MKVIVIGGGIIGLSAAYYLKKNGHEVTVIDKSDFTNNCSFGSSGYICPSHFIPLATPTNVKRGIKWMFNSKSPFYIQPRLNVELMSWALKFMRSAKSKKVEAAAIPLRDLSLFSKAAYESWLQNPAFDFGYEQKGLLEIFQTEKYANHAHHIYEKAHELGLTDTVMLTAEELQALEPQTKVNGMGALLYHCDAQCNPNLLMKNLKQYLQDQQVHFIAHEEVIQFEKKNKTVTKTITTKNAYESDEIVIANGSFSVATAKLLQLNIPLIPGRGYSVTYEDSPYQLNYPALLMEGRAAVTPIGKNKIRFGGTMEITSYKTPVRMNRVQGILETVKRFYPEFDAPMPTVENVWYGYRPCSADGLPFIGRPSSFENITIATGHSMLGISLGAGTGKLVGEIVDRKKTGMDITPFRIERFR